MNKNSIGICSIILVMILAGCASVTASPVIAPTLSPSPTNTPIPTITATPTATFTPTSTVTPTPTSTRTSTITPTPGPDLNFLYLAQGSIQEYDMLTWTSEKLPVQSEGEIVEAALSPDQSWLAYLDEIGIKILAYPFNQQSVSITSNQSVGANFLFSNNSELLAYTDDEGLKIFNLPEQTSTLLLAHVLDESDEDSYAFYYPRQWSPDSQWLWIGAGHYEGSTRLLAHILSQTFHEYTACYDDPAWLPTSLVFLTTVSTSDYLGCGWEAGVYRVETAGVNSIREKRIYQETEPVDMWIHLPYGLQVSPDGKMISFVQPSAPYEDLPSRLILIDLASNESKVLDTREDDIITPIWSADGEKLFYAVQGENASQIISLSIDSGETVILGVVLKTANILTTLADGDWLVVGTVELFTHWESLYLVNTTSGAVVKIAKLDYETYFPPFLGIVSAR